MLKNFFNSTTFRKTFISYIIILIIPMLIFSFTSTRNGIMEERKNIYNNYSADAVRISDAIDEKLKELKRLGEAAANEAWIRKLMVDDNIYKDTFDYSRDIEIRQNMANIISPSGIIVFGGVLYPEKDKMVTQWGTFSTEYFFNSIATFDDEYHILLQNSINKFNIFNVILPADMKLWGYKRSVIPVLQSLEIVNNPRAVLVLFIDSSYLSSYIQEIQGTGPITVDIMYDGRKIYSKSNVKNISLKGSSKKAETFSIESKVSGWRYRFLYPSSGNLIGAKSFLSFLIDIILSFLIVSLLAFLLARISYKPLYVLINKMSLNNRYDQIEGCDHVSLDSEYNVIEKSFNQLLNENSTLHQIVNDYKSAAKGNILLRLLKGYFNDGHKIERLKEFGLDYTDEMYFCTLLTNFNYSYDNKNSSAVDKIEVIVLALIEKVMNNYKLSFQVLEVDNAQKAIIISSNSPFDRNDQVRKAADEIIDELQKSCGISADILYGNVERGLIGISKSYYMANEELQHMMFSRRNTESDNNRIYIDNYYYPTDWEVQLINNLKIGNLNTLTHIIDEIKTENFNRNLSENCMVNLVSLLMETMFRVLNELHMDSGIYAKQFVSKLKAGDNNALWDYIYEVGSLICERVRYSNTPSTVEVGKKLLLYVNNNYTSHDMSLKKLSEVFHMSVSNISKMFKDVTGINFFDYLSRLRMELAKEMLREKTYEVNNIAARVGYENVYSFKRAFMRYEGIKPDEYMYK